MNRKEVYILAIITFMTVFSWVVFGVIHAKNTTKVEDAAIRKVVPLTPAFDKDIINQLKSRQEY